MEEIFKQYGGPIITVMVIVAIIVLATFLLKEGGVISEAFTDLINSFKGRGEDAIEGIDTGTIIFNLNRFLG